LAQAITQPVRQSSLENGLLTLPGSKWMKLKSLLFWKGAAASHCVVVSGGSVAKYIAVDS
jgi:hypothetical protein